MTAKPYSLHSRLARPHEMAKTSGILWACYKLMGCKRREQHIPTQKGGCAAGKSLNKQKKVWKVGYFLDKG